MEISVKITKENKDGSADAVVRFDKEGLEVLVQWGLVAMLTAAIDEYKVRPDEAEVSIQSKAKRSVAKKTTIVAKKATKKK
jgi:hypothetical protein